MPQVDRIKNHDNEVFGIYIFWCNSSKKLTAFPLSVKLRFFAYLVAIRIRWIVFTNWNNV
jgi:hypothetical protein